MLCLGAEELVVAQRSDLAGGIRRQFVEEALLALHHAPQHAGEVGLVVTARLPAAGRPALGSRRGLPGPVAVTLAVRPLRRIGGVGSRFGAGLGEAALEREQLPELAAHRLHHAAEVEAIESLAALAAQALEQVAQTANAIVGPTADPALQHVA